jgi:hypothetical protein
MNKLYHQSPIIYGIKEMQLESKPDAITVNDAWSTDDQDIRMS